MDKYEINVWKDAELLSKETLEFESNEECYKYVLEKHYAPGTWTGSHQNKNGVARTENADDEQQPRVETARRGAIALCFFLQHVG